MPPSYKLKDEWRSKQTYTCVTKTTIYFCSRKLPVMIPYGRYVRCVRHHSYFSTDISGYSNTVRYSIRTYQTLRAHARAVTGKAIYVSGWMFCASDFNNMYRYASAHKHRTVQSINIESTLNLINPIRSVNSYHYHYHIPEYCTGIFRVKFTGTVTASSQSS